MLGSSELTTALAVPASPPESLLLVVPPDPGAGAALPADTMVAGLPLLRRLVLAGERAGFSRVLVRRHAGRPDPLLDGTGGSTLDATPGPDGRRRIVILPANVVPQPRWLRMLRETEIATDRVYADHSMTAVIDTESPSVVLAEAARRESVGPLIGALAARFGRSALADDAAGRFPLAGPADTRPAEAWLLRSLIKQREGFMSRHFERRISLALTRRLAATRVTPDAMTVVSLVLGLLAAPFFLSTEPARQLVGALLFLAHSIVDGCDGELARLKFMESPRGARLDFWGDNAVHVAVFLCMAIGLGASQAAAWPLALGALAIASTIGAAVFVSRRTMLDTALDRNATWTARLVEAFSHRDFIYLVLALSVFGQAHWVLVLASAGTPVFFALLVGMGARTAADTTGRPAESTSR